MKKLFVSESFVLSALLVVYGVLIITFCTFSLSDYFFPMLAQSFAHGQLHYLHKPLNIHDTVFYNNRYFLPLGPFPAVVLVPWAVIAAVLTFSPLMRIPHVVAVAGVVYTWYKITRRIGYSHVPGLYLTLAFVAASAFFGVALFPASWYFAQVLTVLFISLSILEFLGKKRWILIGILMGFVLATRLSAGLGLIFYILMIIRDKRPGRIGMLIKLVIPVGIAVLLLAIYNYARFDSLLEHGYNWQILGEKYRVNRDVGLHSIAHIPGNLYYFLLSGPLPVFKDSISHVLKFPFISGNKWGLSIFVTSPYLLYLFVVKLKHELSKPLIITSCIVAIPIITYYGIGYNQFGYRYSLDFLPWLHLLLLINMDKKAGVTRRLKVLILGGAVFNFYLIMAQFALP